MQLIDVLKLCLNSFEMLACAAGFANWKKIKGTHYKCIPIYLAFIVAAEFTGKYFTLQEMNSSKIILYDYIVIPTEFLFFLWVFYKEFYPDKTLPLFSAGIYILCWLLDIFLIADKTFWFLSFSYTVGNIVLVINVLHFFYKLVKSDQILFFKTNIMFWVCCGLLIFYLGTLPFFGLGNTLLKNYKSLYIDYAYTTYVFNCLMYLLFSIGLVWGKLRSSLL